MKSNISKIPSWGKWILIVGSVYLMLLSIGMIGSGFKWAAGGSEGAIALFEFASNPFAGLLMGILATALVQSSSTVTSVIVGLVAGGMPVEIAIPMVMGANIGTTVTNTIVSLAHINDKVEFKRAFAAATTHDFFNALAVIIFLPLELLFGVLSKIGVFFAELAVDADSLSIKGFNFIKPITKPVISEFKEVLAVMPELGSVPLGGVTLAVLGVCFVFLSIMWLGKIMKELMGEKAKVTLNKSIENNPVAGIATGTVVTVLVQSSSTTTSLAIPLVGNGVFSVRQIYPFLLGANIGTTITALLAATAITGDMAISALTIAFVHLAFNVLGVLVIYGLPFLRYIPILLSEWLAEKATEQKAIVLMYVLLSFFVIPASLVVFTLYL